MSRILRVGNKVRITETGEEGIVAHITIAPVKVLINTKPGSEEVHNYRTANEEDVILLE